MNNKIIIGDLVQPISEVYRRTKGGGRVGLVINIQVTTKSATTTLTEDRYCSELATIKWLTTSDGEEEEKITLMDCDLLMKIAISDNDE